MDFFIGALIGMCLMFCVCAENFVSGHFADLAVAACEAKLPRDQHCAITATPVLKVEK